MPGPTSSANARKESDALLTLRIAVKALCAEEPKVGAVLQEIHQLKYDIFSPIDSFASAVQRQEYTNNCCAILKQAITTPEKADPARIALAIISWVSPDTSTRESSSSNSYPIQFNRRTTPSDPFDVELERILNVVTEWGRLNNLLESAPNKRSPAVSETSRAAVEWAVEVLPGALTIPLADPGALRSLVRSRIPRTDLIQGEYAKLPEDIRTGSGRRPYCDQIENAFVGDLLAGRAIVTVRMASEILSIPENSRFLAELQGKGRAHSESGPPPTEQLTAREFMLDKLAGIVLLGLVFKPRDPELALEFPSSRFSKFIAESIATYGTQATVDAALGCIKNGASAVIDAAMPPSISGIRNSGSWYWVANLVEAIRPHLSPEQKTALGTLRPHFEKAVSEMRQKRDSLPADQGAALAQQMLFLASALGAEAPGQPFKAPLRVDEIERVAAHSAGNVETPFPILAFRDLLYWRQVLSAGESSIDSVRLQNNLLSSPNQKILLASLERRINHWRENGHDIQTGLDISRLCQLFHPVANQDGQSILRKIEREIVSSVLTPKSAVPVEFLPGHLLAGSGRDEVLLPALATSVQSTLAEHQRTRGNRDDIFNALRYYFESPQSASALGDAIASRPEIGGLFYAHMAALAANSAPLAAALSSVVIPSEDSRSQIFRFATLRLTDLPVAQSLFTNISRPLSNAFSRMLTGAAPDFTRALAAAPETLEKRLPAGRYNLQTPSKIILPSTLRLCAFMTLHGWFGEQRTNIVRLAQDPQGCRALKIVVTEAASYIEALDQALRNHERSRVFKAATERQVALTLIASYNELPGSSQDAALALRTLKIKESLSRNLSTNLERL